MHSGPADIARAVDRLRDGRAVAFPTETVYGLGADAMSEAAVRAVFELKGRPSDNPLIVHVADEAMTRRVCAEWPPEAELLARRFWPGPLTLVLPRRREVPDIVTAGGTTVAVRCPSHPLALALIEAFGNPIVGPSANRSGHVSPTAAEHVRDSFGEGDVLVLDGGPCKGGIESTVVDLAGTEFRVLRPGLITPEEIGAVLGKMVAHAASEQAHATGPARSPGRIGAHYAPVAPARLVDPESLDAELRRCGTGASVLAPESTEIPRPHRLIAMPGDAAAYAARLYAALREADVAGPAMILIVRPWPGPDPAGLWISIADRLRRASAASER